MNPIAADMAEALRAWAEPRSEVRGLVLIGSRERPPTDIVGGADEHSDWDFHVITSRPGIFDNAEWTKQIAGVSLRSYWVRPAVLGGVPRATIVFDRGEIDVVVISTAILRRMRRGAWCGLHRKPGWTRQRWQDLAVVIRPGWRFLKSHPQSEALYCRALTLVPDPRLSDAMARSLAEAFLCQWVWGRRKLARGEYVAAQRMIHRELAETNLRLLHELKLRRGETTFPEARRIERTATAAELTAVSVDARLRGDDLQKALEKTAATFRALMHELVGGAWIWPDVG